MKILKMMKSLLKKTKARRQFVEQIHLKKLKKLRKWMDLLNPTLKLNLEDNFKEVWFLILFESMLEALAGKEGLD